MIGLKEWLEEVDRMGELKRIRGVSWDQEIGCLSQLNRNKKAPALLFENIKDYTTGSSVLCSALKTPSRLARTLGLLPVCSDSELLKVLPGKLRDWEAKAKDFPPRVVTTGPILENVHSGKDINLFEFPVPKWHELDGGRYIGTGDAVITRAPDVEEINLGTYRVMVHNANTTALYISPGHHGRIHYEKYHQRGEACPVAVSVGHHPLILLVGSLPLPFGTEYNFAGAIMGNPIEVIKEEVTGLPIPAHSEIVIAGFCPPGKAMVEGPFGEWSGYYGSGERPAPIIEVERVYHRNNPIIFGAPPYRPPSDSTYYTNVLKSAILYNDLIRGGVPDVKAVWLSDAGLHLLTIVSIKQRYAGHAKQAALLACQSRVSAYAGRYVVVVDEDIDPTNLNDVVWALCTRSDPEKDIDIIRRAWSTPLDPMIRKPTTGYFNSRAIIDACKPYEWIEEFPKEVKPNVELEHRMKMEWDAMLEM